MQRGSDHHFCILARHTGTDIVTTPTPLDTDSLSVLDVAIDDEQKYTNVMSVIEDVMSCFTVLLPAAGQGCEVC